MHIRTKNSFFYSITYIPEMLKVLKYLFPIRIEKKLFFISINVKVICSLKLSRVDGVMFEFFSGLSNELNNWSLTVSMFPGRNIWNEPKKLTFWHPKKIDFCLKQLYGFKADNTEERRITFSFESLIGVSQQK